MDRNALVLLLLAVPTVILARGEPASSATAGHVSAGKVALVLDCAVVGSAACDGSGLPVGSVSYHQEQDPVGDLGLEVRLKDGNPRLTGSDERGIPLGYDVSFVCGSADAGDGSCGEAPYTLARGILPVDGKGRNTGWLTIRAGDLVDPETQRALGGPGPKLGRLLLVGRGTCEGCGALLVAGLIPFTVPAP